MRFLILADKDDYLITCVENETKDFYSTDDVSEFISKRADICFVDFGAVCSVFYLGDSTWELRQLVKHIRENQNTMFYFCFIMPSNCYDEYDELWSLKNAIKVTYSEWVKGDAIKRIISGTYIKGNENE